MIKRYQIHYYFPTVYYNKIFMYFSFVDDDNSFLCTRVSLIRKIISSICKKPVVVKYFTLSNKQHCQKKIYWIKQKNKPKIILIRQNSCNIIEIKYYTTFQNVENYINIIHGLKKNQYILIDIYGNNFLSLFNNQYHLYLNGIITNIADKYYYHQPLNMIIIENGKTYQDYIMTQDKIDSLQTTVCIYKIFIQKSNSNCKKIK